MPIQLQTAESEYMGSPFGTLPSDKHARDCVDEAAESPSSKSCASTKTGHPAEGRQIYPHIFPILHLPSGPILSYVRCRLEVAADPLLDLSLPFQQTEMMSMR